VAKPLLRKHRRWPQESPEICSLSGQLAQQRSLTAKNGLHIEIDAGLAPLHRSRSFGFHYFPFVVSLPYVTGLGLSVTGAFNVKSQPVTFPDLVWIDAS
jgi:hypothetical protein